MSENLIDELPAEQPDRDELPAGADGHADDAEAVEDNNPEGLTNADVA